MAPAICQGLQSCLEPGLTEQQAMGKRLISLKPHIFWRTEIEMGITRPSWLKQVSDTDTTENRCNNLDKEQKDLGTFIAIQSLASISKDGFSSHTLSKRSFSSEKSLELCTENLGCETGTDVTANDFSSFPSHSSQSSKHTEMRKRVNSFQISKTENFGSFPPPLTSITSESCTHIRPHRENGRLVIKAVTASCMHTYFQAERSNGRLRLRFLKLSCPSFHVEGINQEGEPRKDFTEDCSEKENTVVKEAEEQEEAEPSDRVCSVRRRNVEGMNDNENDGRDEFEVGKFHRQGRCKEGGHGSKRLLNWEPFWVASS